MARALKFEMSILSARQFEGLSLCRPTAVLAQFSGYIDGDTVVTTNIGTHSIYRS